MIITLAYMQCFTKVEFFFFFFFSLLNKIILLKRSKANRKKGEAPHQLYLSSRERTIEMGTEPSHLQKEAHRPTQ
jgi:hypothetical protein